MIVHQLPPADWAQISVNLHKVAFQETMTADQDRIDFALVVGNDQYPMVGYVTCKEWDRDSVYWQFGGALHGAKNTALSFRGYQAMIDWCLYRYKVLTTRIENENLVMLKFAMKVGFRIVGTTCIRGRVYLEHWLERKEA
jgi:hypothetical protein